MLSKIIFVHENRSCLPMRLLEIRDNTTAKYACRDTSPYSHWNKKETLFTFLWFNMHLDFIADTLNDISFCPCNSTLKSSFELYCTQNKERQIQQSEAGAELKNSMAMLPRWWINKKKFKTGFPMCAEMVKQIEQIFMHKSAKS